jgi:hypothetical protein
LVKHAFTKPGEEMSAFSFFFNNIFNPTETPILKTFTLVITEDEALEALATYINTHVLMHSATFVHGRQLVVDNEPLIELAFTYEEKNNEQES